MSAFSFLKNHRTEAGVGLATLSCYLVRLMYLCRLPDAALIGYLPDDAFYYIRLAQNFAASSRWTFDGASPATGFHLLWGYLLAALLAVAPATGWRTIFLLSGLLGAVLFALSAALLSVLARELFGKWAVAGVLGLFLCSGMISIATLALETPLALLSVTLAVLLIHNAEKMRFNFVTVLASLAAGTIGSLSRSDFGLAPFSLAVVMGLCVLTTRGSVRSFLAALYVTAGAVLGVGLVMLNCYLVSGYLTQSSAKQKFYWSSHAGNRIGNSLQMFRFLNPAGRLPGGLEARYLLLQNVFYLLVLLAGTVIVIRYAWRRRITYPLALPWAIASPLIVWGYIYLYRYDSLSIQPWYLVNLAVPLALCLGALAASAARMVQHGVWLLPVGLLLFGCQSSYRPQWPEQQKLMAAGRYLVDHPVPERIGAWNAGILNYFSHGRVINLDGLVNDEIYGYSARGRLLDYLDRRKVVSIVDYKTQFGFPVWRLGVSPEELGACFSPPTTLVPDARPGGEEWSSVVVVTRWPCKRQEDEPGQLALIP